MEEKKLAVEKPIKGGNPKKLSYEELNQACMELSQQNQQMQKYIQQLRNQMQQMDAALQTKRVDYLFKVMEISLIPSPLYHFDPDFVHECVKEIQEALSVPEETEKTGEGQ